MPYLENEYLPWWNKTLTVRSENAEDAHRPLGNEHDLMAILSHVEKRQVTNDYTLRWEGKFYQIDRRDVKPGMRKSWVRVEQRLDGTLAVRFKDQYVRVRRCAQPIRELQPAPVVAAKPPKPARSTPGSIYTRGATPGRRQKSTLYSTFGLVAVSRNPRNSQRLESASDLCRWQLLPAFSQSAAIALGLLRGLKDRCFVGVVGQWPPVLFQVSLQDGSCSPPWSHCSQGERTIGCSHRRSC